MTLRMNDLVEIQRALTTLGNYYMSLAENNYKSKRMEHLNEAYSHYLKSYDILNDIWDKKLVDSKEFYLMKARTCLNCGKIFLNMFYKNKYLLINKIKSFCNG